MKRYNLYCMDEENGETSCEQLQCGDGHWVPASVAKALYDALVQTRSIVCDGCEEGFNPLAGDWAERLFYNNASITKALSLADGEE